MLSQRSQPKARLYNLESIRASSKIDKGKRKTGNQSQPRRTSRPYMTLCKKVSKDAYKSCYLECEGTEGFEQVCALTRWILEPWWDVAAVQETHFICPADGQVLRNGVVVLSAFGGRCGAGVSLLIGRSLNVDVNLVYASGWLLVVLTWKASLFE